ncbi:unnamed protein product [Clonostachys byssicola]|uniref:Major facilitator superfamily (MFS) profile domain-containing protein n=1 Tax=Clonostachys byssicola TaxID=160290 RepID=A0A9N9V112_9HYPO|nr:unnamed protein product [Clonostachys byssicola]
MGTKATGPDALGSGEQYPDLKTEVHDNTLEETVVSTEVKPAGSGPPSDPESDDRHKEQIILKDGQEHLISWTLDEERRVVRKADLLFLPIFTVMFTWMAIDRTNVSGVLSSTFFEDTSISRDQANTGVSLLWLGIVLLEIPSNIVLHRIGAHYWIPFQVILWGIIEVLQMFVTNAGGWYAARLFLGLAESGFIPGALYTLSRWYTKDELASRTAIFFFGASIAAAFGSLISAGALRLHGVNDRPGWHWIFIICGVSTIATGVLGLITIPKSPYHTNRLLAGLIPSRGWLSDREADVFTARIAKANDKNQDATLHIRFADIRDVFADWRLWPHLVNLPVTSKSSWSFYAALFVATAAPGWQSINVTWLALNAKTPQKRAISYAVYIACSNLGGTYGNQFFRGDDAPLYKRAWAACISLAVIWLVAVSLQTTALKVVNRRWANQYNPDENAESDARYTDRHGRKHLNYW